METKLPGILGAIAAVAIGGLLLSDKVKIRPGSSADVSVDESLDVRVPPSKALFTVAALALGGWFLTRQMRTRVGGSRSESVEESIELDVPVTTAYNQWTQFEEFPRFMPNVQEVRQIDDTHLHWRANFAGKTKEWDAEITEQIPDQRIAWRSIGGVRNSGIVTFNKVADNRTRVTLQMNYEPQTVQEKIGDAVGGVKLATKGNLKRFKELVEQRGVETGAWRGTVTQPH